MIIRDNRKIVSQLMKFVLGLTYRRNMFFNLLCVTLIFFFTFLFWFSLSQSFFSWCIPWQEISNSSENFWLLGDFCTIKAIVLLKIASNSLESVPFAKIIHQNFERNVSLLALIFQESGSTWVWYPLYEISTVLNFAVFCVKSWRIWNVWVDKNLFSIVRMWLDPNCCKTV